MHPTLSRTLRWFGLLEAGRRIELRQRLRHPRALPGAMIIGAMKCGTSSLHNYLCQHPGVNPPLRKEVHYFDMHYDRGEPWYRANFGRADAGGLNLDSTPYYLFHPAVPARAAALVPAAKLVVLLRDPVRRAYSHYWHERDTGRETLPFEDAIAAEPDRLGDAQARLAAGAIEHSAAHQHFSYLSRGLYAEQLGRWLQHYPRERLLLLRFEDLAADPLAVLNRTLGWLGLDAIGRVRLEARNTRSYPPMAAATAARLEEHFAPHNAALEALVGEAMHWQAAPARA
ncbi:MAG: sulfotransferase domain-containing protein [Steroidobacteraceae bacterium]